jgi:hypothetical protein
MEIKPKVTFTVPTELTEGELRALDALVGYGFDNFIKMFYSGLGKHYMQPYEADLKLLFQKVESLRPQIDKINKARESLNIRKV